jgi:hypothetical protein
MLLTSMVDSKTINSLFNRTRVGISRSPDSAPCIYAPVRNQTEGWRPRSLSEPPSYYFRVSSSLMDRVAVKENCFACLHAPKQVDCTRLYISKELEEW